MGILYSKSKDLNTKAYEKKLNAPITKERDSILELIENARTEYSGILKLNSEIPIYKKECIKSQNDLQAKGKTRS